MREGIQEQEQVGLHHRPRRDNLVHFLRSWHRRRILQYIKWAPTQRFKCSLLQDLREDVIRVREIASEEGREGSESRIHRLAHVSDGHLIP